jgi:DUF971 family protein
MMPIKVEPYSASEIFIGFNDQSAFVIDYVELRFECPCAVCVDENTGKRVITRESIKTGIRVLGAEVIGRYALQFDWSDGHSTGMYHFDRLYELCKARGRMLLAPSMNLGAITLTP